MIGRTSRWTPGRAWRLECRLLLVVHLVIVTLAGLGMAQPPIMLPGVESDELYSACRKADEADAVERDLAVHRQSAQLDAALQSESIFWKFLIDPSTAYLDRMAAAHRGGSRVSPEQLPRLWKAYAEFEVLPPGVNPRPCEFIRNAWGARSPSVWERRKQVPVPGTVSPKPESRTVLGFKTQLPEKAIDYPLNIDDRNDTPWVWQMRRALSILVPNVREYYADPGRYDSMAEVALRWHPDNFYEKEVRTRALAQGPRNASWVRVQLKLALDEGLGAGVLYTYGDDSLHLEELIHVAHIAIIEQTRDSKVAAASSFQLAEMKKKTPTWSPNLWFGWRPLRSATSVLAIAQWAMNISLSVHERYCFASSICEIVDSPPFKPNMSVLRNSQEEADALVHIEGWLYPNQQILQRRAAAEIDGLAALAAELGTHVEVPPRIATRWDRH